MNMTEAEKQILNDPTIPNTFARAQALEKLRATMAPIPPGPPAWATPSVAAELRGIVDEIKRTGADIVSHDELTKKHREAQDGTRGRIYQLENPTAWPTEKDAMELATLKSLLVQQASFLGTGADRRSALVSKVWATVSRLTRRLFELSGRSHWDAFDNRNVNRPENVHPVASREVERVLAGQKDRFDIMNEVPGVRPNFIR
jgi:hypothetical protein